MNDIVENETTDENSSIEAVKYSRKFDPENGTFALMEGSGDDRKELESYTLNGVPQSVIMALALKCAAQESLYIFRRDGVDAVNELHDSWQDGIFKATAEPLADRQRWEAIRDVMVKRGMADATIETAKSWWMQYEIADLRKKGNGKAGCSPDQVNMLNYPMFIETFTAIQLRDREASIVRKNARLAKQTVDVIDPFAS